jgi:hypothetical protein
MKSIGELLSLRFQYESFILNFEIPEKRKSSCINNIKWFTKNGHVNNRFRKGYKECTDICNTILKEYYKRE